MPPPGEEIVLRWILSTLQGNQSFIDLANKQIPAVSASPRKPAAKSASKSAGIASKSAGIASKSRSGKRSKVMEFESNSSESSESSSNSSESSEEFDSNSDDETDDSGSFSDSDFASDSSSNSSSNSSDSSSDSSDSSYSAHKRKIPAGKPSSKRRRTAVLSSESSSEADQWEDRCAICQKKGDLLCCDGCPSVFHLKCVGLTVEAGRFADG